MTAIAKPGNLASRMLFLLLSGMLAGVLVNALRPGGIDWVYAWSGHVESLARDAGVGLIPVERLHAVHAAGEWMVVDARSDEEYAAGRIPGALSLPLRDADTRFPEIALFLFPEQPVVTYCSGPACQDALLLARFLTEQGYTNVFLFAGGMEAWQRARHLVEGAP